MRQQDDLVVAGALRGGNGAQAGQCGLDLGLRASQVVLRRFAEGRGAQPYMKCRDFALQAAELLHLVERHDDRAGLKRRAAVVNARDDKRTALNLQRIAGILLQV